MTDNGRRVLNIMFELEQKDAGSDNTWFEASRIAKHFREKFPQMGIVTTMTISAILTHMKREHLVERHAGSDKKFAWWRMTTKGREAADA